MRSYQMIANPAVTVQAASIISVVLMDKHGFNNGASLLTEDGLTVAVDATFVHLFKPKPGAFYIVQKVGGALYQGSRGFAKDWRLLELK